MIKQVFIQLGWWVEKPTDTTYTQVPDLTTSTIVEAVWYEKAKRHNCVLCDRWFTDTRGKIMHDRHKHKPV